MVSAVLIAGHLASVAQLADDPGSGSAVAKLGIPISLRAAAHTHARRNPSESSTAASASFNLADVMIYVPSVLAPQRWSKSPRAFGSTVRRMSGRVMTGT